jgi:hypothetical protein
MALVHYHRIATIARQLALTTHPAALIVRGSEKNHSHLQRRGCPRGTGGRSSATQHRTRNDGPPQLLDCGFMALQRDSHPVDFRKVRIKIFYPTD